MSTETLERLTIEQSATTFKYYYERMRRMMTTVVYDDLNLIIHSHVRWLLETTKMKKSIEFSRIFKMVENQLRICIVCNEVKQNKTTVDNHRPTGPFRRTCIARDATVSSPDTKVGDIQPDRPGRRFAEVIRQNANMANLS